MNQPGLSLFQGAGSLHLNTSAQRLEDEEELLDQQRRREEVQHRLDNEFGDLSDDNDETNASAVSEYRTNNGAAQQFPNANNNNAPQAQAPPQPHNGHAIHQFAANTQQPPLNGDKITPPYDERAALLAKFNDQQQLEELKRRVALSESEKQRAFMARQQSHELLVESKGKISELDDTVQKLKAKLKASEAANTELATQLECKQTMLNDALLKAQMIERNAGLTSDRNADLAIKQAHDRCTAQAAMHQQQLDGVRTQLADREQELKMLQARYAELQRSREALLVEKSDTINQLSKSVEEAQRHNQQLMARSAGGHGESFEENARLRGVVNQMSGQIAQLERSLDTANAELTAMTSLIHDSHAAEPSHGAVGTPKLQQQRQHASNSSSTPVLLDTTARLRAELGRCIADQRERRGEVQQLQRQLDERDAEIGALKTAENRLLVEMETLRADAQRAAMQLKHLSGDLQRLFRLHGRTDEVHSSNAHKVIDAIELAQERAMTELEEVKCELLRVKADRRELEQRLRSAPAESTASNMREDVEAINKELETERLRTVSLEEKVVELNARLKSAEAELKDLQSHNNSDLNGRVTQMIKTEAALRDEIGTLNVQLAQANHAVAELKASMAAKHDNDQLLADLQAKAIRFDQYIQQQQQRPQQQSDAASASLAQSRNETTPERCASAPNHRTPAAGTPTTPADERRMAAVLAKKLKTIETAAKLEETHLRSAIQQLDAELTSVRSALEFRDGEVLVLKSVILAERSSVKAMMEQRDAEVGDLFEKQQCTMDKYRERLDGAQDTIERLKERIVEMTAELRVLVEQRDRLTLDTERLKADRDRQAGEREAAAERENELRRNVERLETDRADLIDEWQRKYVAAKKTAASYKRYAEDKDAHIARENERIKAEYKRALERMQGNAERVIKG